MNVFEEKWVKAMNQYECDLCHGGIAVNETYYYENAYEWGGKYYIFRTCKPCKEDDILNLVYDWLGDDVEYEDVMSWAMEKYGEDSPDKDKAIGVLDRCYPPIEGYSPKHQPFQLP